MSQSPLFTGSTKPSGAHYDHPDLRQQSCCTRRVLRKVAGMSRLQTHDGETAPPMAGASSRLGAGHVLIADPNDETRARRQSQLREAGFRVSLARTGFEAIVKACCHVPDWILIDASLTGLEAAETGRLITTCPVTAHIPVIQLSAGQRLPQRIFQRMRRLLS
jgi:CheY-like chemotaxis protein